MSALGFKKLILLKNQLEYITKSLCNSLYDISREKYLKYYRRAFIPIFLVIFIYMTEFFFAKSIESFMPILYSLLA